MPRGRQRSRRRGASGTRAIAAAAALAAMVAPAASSAAAGPPPDQAAGPRLVLERRGEPGDSTRWRFGVRGVPAPVLAAAAERGWSDRDWQAVFSAHVEDERRPPVLGRYRVAGAELWLEPAFPVEAGISYVAVLRPGRLRERLAEAATGLPDGTLDGLGAVDLRSRLAVPAPPRVSPPAAVAAVYPSTAELPENLLRFYVHFTAPMSRGAALRWIRLEDPSGAPIADAFLDLPEELWDAEGRRLTLLLDPGRIKSGLRPRAELGRALAAGTSVILAIDGGWPDATGRPVAAPWRRRFSVVAADVDPPDPLRWRVEPAAGGTRNAVRVVLDEALDRALLERLVWIEDGAGRPLPGAVAIGGVEQTWSFVPAAPWTSGEHALRVDRRLEDRAGNRIDRPFEVDLAAAPSASGPDAAAAEGGERSPGPPGRSPATRAAIEAPLRVPFEVAPAQP